MAAESETLTITLPADLLRDIRARVEEGNYTSDNALILHDLQEAALWNRLPAAPLGSLEEVLAEIPAQLARIDRGEEQLYTHDEVVAKLDAMSKEYLSR